MEVVYDKTAQAVYIKFRDVSDGEIDHSEELSDTILLDKTKSGEIVGIDILEIDSIELGR